MPTTSPSLSSFVHAVTDTAPNGGLSARSVPLLQPLAAVPDPRPRRGERSRPQDGYDYVPCANKDVLSTIGGTAKPLRKRHLAGRTVSENERENKAQQPGLDSTSIRIARGCKNSRRCTLDGELGPEEFFSLLTPASELSRDLLLVELINSRGQRLSIARGDTDPCTGPD